MEQDKSQFMYKQFFKKYEDDDFCPECWSEMTDYVHIYNWKYKLCDVCYNKLEDINKSMFTDFIEVDNSMIFGSSYNYKSAPDCFLCEHKLFSDGQGREYYYKIWYYGHRLLTSNLNICEECYETLK